MQGTDSSLAMTRVAWQLDAGGQVVAEHVTAGLIAREIAALDGGTDSFIVLQREPMYYMQVAGSADEGYQLEYQDGSIEKHFMCTEQDLDQQQLTEAMQRYLAGDTRWRTDLAWEQYDLGPSTEAGFEAGPLLVKLIALVVLAFVVGLLFR